MSANGIAQLETREARQIAKLDLAQNKRQGNVLTVYNGLTSISTSGSGPGEFRNRPADWSFMQNVQIGWTINGPNIINGPVPITNIVYSAPQERAFIFHTGGTQNDEWSTVGQTGYIFSGYLSDPTTPAYRTRATYDITQLPTQYDGNNIVDNANTGGLLQGRPWNPDTIITVIEEGLVLNLDARNLNSWS